jgi:hypothetical protein
MFKTQGQRASLKVLFTRRIQMIRCFYSGKRTTAKRVAAQIITRELDDIMYWDRWEDMHMTPKDKDKIMVELNTYLREIRNFVDPFC